METYQAIALSTSHIERSDAVALNLAGKQTEMVFERDSGYLIKLYTDDLALNIRSDYSPSLKRVVEFAYERNFALIELDVAAEVLDELHQHSW